MTTMAARGVDAAPTAGKLASGRRSASPRLRRLAGQSLVWVAVVVAWEALRAAGIVSPDLLPSLADVVREAPAVLGSSVFWSMLGATLQGAVLGFLWALAVGIPVGLLIGRSRFVERSTRLIIDFCRSFPTVALLPVLLLIFGTTPTMKTMVVFFACVWPVLIQSMYGAMRIDPAIGETVRAYRIPRRLSYFRVVLPSAVPFIATGVRLAATTSVLVAVAVEVLASVDGLGRQISNLQIDGQTTTAYVYIFAGGVLGYAINRGAHMAEGHLLRWRPPARGE